jgi:MinD-like ATPase involved in chromosome partitioning or flagellar assembly
MAADYDRLFLSSEGPDDEAGANADYDLEGPPPMPVDRATPPAPARPQRPPMPVDVAPRPNGHAPAPPSRRARHARQGQSDSPDYPLGNRVKSQHSHRAQQGSPRPTARSVPLKAPPQAPQAPTAPATRPVTPPEQRPEQRADRRDKPALTAQGSVSTSAQPAGRTVSRRGWRRWLHATTRINVGLSRDEKYEIELQNRIRRAIRGSYEIGVLGLKGGAGKTIVTATLGSAFAHVRGDRILAVDADPISGNLGERVGRQTPATVADLVANRALSHYNDIRAHTSMNGVNLEVLAAADYNGASESLTEEDWTRAVATVPRYYNLVLADCGADLFGPAARGVLATASGLVITSGASIDGARQATVALDWLRNNNYLDLLSRACVVINQVVPGESTKAVDELVRHFRQRVQPGRVLVLPWDEHIAAGNEIQFDLLSAGYRRKIVELAASLSDDFDRGESR